VVGVSDFELMELSEPNDSILEPFYDLYSQVFTLEEEREPIEAFRAILDMNSRTDLQRDFGPYCEYITVAKARDSRVIALANYILYAYPGGAYEFSGSSQLNFICVAPDARGQGMATQLLRFLETRVDAFATAHTGEPSPRTFITIEQNNPSRMTPEQRRRDEAAAGISSERRNRWWRRQGYRRLDFPYVQPPLSEEQEACRYIDYYARLLGPGSADFNSLPSAQLLDHLRRYFFISVGKFEFDMASCEEWREQKVFLESTKRIALRKHLHARLIWNWLPARINRNASSKG
jgi:GNAT superfamily N-acetyltransferase